MWKSLLILTDVMLFKDTHIRKASGIFLLVRLILTSPILGTLTIPPSRITALSWWRGLSNSVKLWAMPWRATQDGWVIAESSDKMWSTGGGNGKPPQYTWHENLMNCIKGQKDMTPKDESSRSEGFNMFLGKSRGELPTDPEWMKQLGQSRYNAQLWMCLGMKVKSDAAKNSIA